nr:MAG TPA: hypothetical protein [Bacteriophage sp.]
MKVLFTPNTHIIPPKNIKTWHRIVCNTIAKNIT